MGRSLQDINARDDIQEYFPKPLSPLSKVVLPTGITESLASRDCQPILNRAFSSDRLTPDDCLIDERGVPSMQIERPKCLRHRLTS